MGGCSIQPGWIIFPELDGAKEESAVLVELEIHPASQRIFVSLATFLGKI